MLSELYLMRIFDVLLVKWDRLPGTVHKLKAADARMIDRYRQALDFVGLNFNFEE